MAVFSFLLSQVRTSQTAMVGGQVYFYDAGTTNPKAVFLDSAETMPASNPYTLDSNGTARIYGTGIYRVVIKDLSGVTRFDRDDISPDLIAPWWIDARHYPTLVDADQFAQAAGNLLPAVSGKCLVIADNHTLSENLTLNAPVSVVPGGSFTVPNGIILTLNGPFSAGLFQVFRCTGAGKVLFGPAATENVYPEWWGGETPAVSGIQLAINSSSYHKRIVLSADQYDVYATLTVPSNTHVIGICKPSRLYAHHNNAIIRVINPATTVNGVGIIQAGWAVVQNTTLENLYISSVDAYNPIYGVEVIAGAKLHILKCEVTRCGTHQLVLRQVWDSVFDQNYFDNGYAGYSVTGGTDATYTGLSDAAVLIHSGGVDNCNNLRFTSNTWEQLQHGAIRSQTPVSGGAEYNYNMLFVGNKFENANRSGLASAYIALDCATGGCNGWQFYSTICAFNQYVNHSFINCVNARNITIHSIQALAYSAPSPGYNNDFIKIDNCKLVSVHSVYMYFANTDTGTTHLNTLYLIKDVGFASSRSSSMVNVTNVIFNDIQLSRFFNTTIGTATNWTQDYNVIPHEIHQRVDGIYVNRLTTKNGSTPIQYDTLASNGALQLYSDVDGTYKILSEYDPLGRFRVQKDLIQDNHGWDTSAIVLGSHRLWVDGSGRLRIKIGTPSSDTDGVVVGAQT
jgi:hypothetical protein